MAIPLQELLERRFGVGEDAFAAALVEFADRTGPLALVDLRPAEHFGERQQATLRKLGASLHPLRADELGPIAGLAAAYAELVANSLSVATLAKRLGVDTSRVRQRIYAGSLYAFKHHGRWLAPAFQLRGRTLIPGLDVVVGELSLALHPVAVARWFTTRNADLTAGGESVSPIEWLVSGSPAEPVGALAGSVDQL